MSYSIDVGAIQSQIPQVALSPTDKAALDKVSALFDSMNKSLDQLEPKALSDIVKTGVASRIKAQANTQHETLRTASNAVGPDVMFWLKPGTTPSVAGLNKASAVVNDAITTLDASLIKAGEPGAREIDIARAYLQLLKDGITNEIHSRSSALQSPPQAMTRSPASPANVMRDQALAPRKK